MLSTEYCACCGQNVPVLTTLNEFVEHWTGDPTRSVFYKCPGSNATPRMARELSEG